MASARKPVCFVAMAFDRPDTDLIYDAQIAPVLQRNHVKPVIINRRQSNQDLNLQIIDSLLHCDFCIADLTYARPSVYFEAGFAQRQVPVIYTVRKDHLGRGQPDELRVHFDLQMKPIITWTDPRDQAFSARLDKRLRSTVLREWQHSQETSEAAAKAKRDFQKLSLSERLVLVRALSISALRKHGYKHWVARDRSDTIRYPPDAVARGKFNHLLSVIRRQGIASLASVQSYQSATKRDLERLKDAYSSWRVDDILTADIVTRARLVAMHHFVLSLRPLPSERIEAVFPRLRPLDPPLCYEDTSTRTYGRGSLKETEVAYASRWYFIGGIESHPQFCEVLTGILSKEMTKSGGLTTR